MTENKNKMKPFKHFGTIAIHAGQDPDQWKSGAVVPLISLSTSFKQKQLEATNQSYVYSRTSNPTRQVVETNVAALENGKYGFLFSSGMAGTSTILHLLTAGDHLVCLDNLYGGTKTYFQDVASDMGITSSFVDLTDPENLRTAIKPSTRMVWIETPSNPLLNIVDIEAAAKITHEHPNVILVTDNTFATPYFQRPLDLGSDISFNSASKYLNGHSDVLIGAVTTNNKELATRLGFLQNAQGNVPSPFDCYLLNRGTKTLHIRMERHQKNGLAVARYLENNPRVEKVLHPGLLSHPHHETARAQMRGYPGMVTFFLRGGVKEVDTFFKHIKIFTLAGSLGGYESLAGHPTLSHASLSKKEKEKLGITYNLIRLSVGLEDIDDLIEDLDQALHAAVKHVKHNGVVDTKSTDQPFFSFFKKK